MSKENGKKIDSDSQWEDLDSEEQAISASLSREEQLKLWKEKKGKKAPSASGSQPKNSSSFRAKKISFSFAERKSLSPAPQSSTIKVQETKKSRKISNEDEMDELDCMKPERRTVLDEDLLRAVRIEIDSLQDSEKLLLDHSDHILKLQEQTVARANTVITRKNDLLDKIDSLLCKFSVQANNSLSTLAGREMYSIQPSLPQVMQIAPNPVLVDSQTQTDFEFEAELQKAAKCVAAYTMVNCANNIMHQKIMEQESKLAEEKENRFKQEEIFKEKISTLECENQLLEGELDKFRLQVVHMQAEIQRLQSGERPKSNTP